MTENSRKIRALALIVERIGRNSRGATYEEINEFLERQDVLISRRTFERYLDSLRYDLMLDIKCDKNTYRYTIADDDERLKAAAHFFQLFNTADLVRKSLKNGAETRSYLSFEAHYGDAVKNNLEPVYQAIAESRLLSFTHENYQKQTTSRHTIKPYLLKEYNAKWYVIGTFTDSNEIRSFGLDRMQNLTIETDTFKKTEQKKINSLFDNLIGLVYDHEKPCVVKLAVPPMQAKYLKNNPLHASQAVDSETDSEVIFSYWLVPNFELRRLILGYGSRMRVVAPQSLVDSIKDELAAMLGFYK
ncbi:MAG: WYL domain-containing protein [Tannerella sp.]|jgi:predicted DNA-binding transcriptional regulator YafY|nr:WYL domain-containing protein [Tannerella sp.]